MQAIEIIVIVLSVLIVIGVVAWRLTVRRRAKKAGIPYTCACCDQAKKVQDGRYSCGGDCAHCQSCAASRQNNSSEDKNSQSKNG